MDKTQPTAKPQYLNERQVAEITGISVQTLRNHRHLGRGIPYVKLDKSVRYNMGDAISYMERRKIQTEPSLEAA